MPAVKGEWDGERKIGLDHEVSVLLPHHLARGLALFTFPTQSFCLSPGA